ncbi:MAG: hypothetical protein LBI57_04940 [Helicobacteraceae bacterium]|jgi:hypothetical protein|nr:hypothetical protein [Helicobacteraceae bacterium]
MADNPLKVKVAADVDGKQLKVFNDELGATAKIARSTGAANASRRILVFLRNLKREKP